MDEAIFSIHDAKAEMFMRPFIARSVGAAIRAFDELVNDREHPVGRHPADYTLFHVGQFNGETGVVTPVPPKSLGNGVLFVMRDPRPGAVKVSEAEFPFDGGAA